MVGGWLERKCSHQLVTLCMVLVRHDCIIVPTIPQPLGTSNRDHCCYRATMKVTTQLSGTVTFINNKDDNEY